MKLNFNRQRVQNKQRLSGLDVLPLSGRQDLALIMLWPRTNFSSGKETDLMIKTHRTASQSPSLPPLGCHLASLRIVPLPIGQLDKRLAEILTVIRSSSSVGRQIRLQVQFCPFDLCDPH